MEENVSGCFFLNTVYIVMLTSLSYRSLIGHLGSSSFPIMHIPQSLAMSCMTDVHEVMEVTDKIQVPQTDKKPSCS